MNTSIRVIAPRRPIKGDVYLPVSKSMANRVLMLKAYAGEMIHDPCEGDAGDTYLLKKHLAKISACPKGEGLILDCENAGTTLRFLTSFLAAREGQWIITGSKRMKERPVEPLVAALRKMDADIEYLERDGFPPLKIKGKKLSSKKVVVDTSVSSQFVSSLLMLAPVLENGLVLERSGENVSASYTTMTIKLLEQASIKVTQNDNIINVTNGNIETESFMAERDWSSAAFWYSLVALSQKGTLLINDLGDPRNSIQGDAIVADIFRSLGVSTNIVEQGILLRKQIHVPAMTRFRINMKSTPDLVLPVVTALSGLGYGALISGIDHLKYKESDRIRAVIAELRALSGNIDYTNNMIVIHPSDLRVLRPVNVYDDHRMAMAFAPLAMVSGAIEIRDPQVVDKSYPAFWDMLGRLGFVMNIK